MTRRWWHNPDNEPAPGTRTWFAALLLDLRYGYLDREGLEGFPRWRMDPGTAIAFLRAQRRAGFPSLVVHFSVVGDVEISDHVDRGIDVKSAIEGSLFVSGSVAKGLRIQGNVGAVGVVGHGFVAGGLHISGKVLARVMVGEHSEVDALWVTRDGSVGGLLIDATGKVGRISIAGSVDGDVVVNGSIRGQIEVFGSINGRVVVLGSLFGGLDVRGGSVAGQVDVQENGVVRAISVWSGSLNGGLMVFGLITSDVNVIAGVVEDDVSVFEGGAVVGHLRVADKGELLGGLQLRGLVRRDLWLRGKVKDDVVLAGRAGSVFLEGRFASRVVLTPTESVTLASVRRAQFDDEVFVGDRVQIESCDFRQCPDLGRLNLVGADLFSPGERELINPPPEAGDGRVPAHEMASIYRQLRSNLETRRNRAAAGLFYRGEMNARLEAARQPDGSNLERFVLAAYKWMSGYGLSVLLPLVWFIGLSFAGAALFMINGVDLDPGWRSPDASCFDAWTFTVRSMLSFFSPPDADLSNWEQWLQIGLRFAGPILLTQEILAIREKVAR